MDKTLSARDRQALSAYLDDELSQRERRRLEAKLARDPQLKAALEEMRELRRLLRSLPEVRAPRNFTLTPEMVGERSWLARWLPSFSLAPSLSWASALATLMLVLVLLGDASGVITGRLAFPVAQQAPQATSMAVTAEELVEEPVEALAEAAQESAPAAALEETSPDLPLGSESPLQVAGTPPVGESLEGDAAVGSTPTPAPSATVEIESTNRITVTAVGESSFADQGEPPAAGGESAGQFLAPMEDQAEAPQPENGALLPHGPSASRTGIPYLQVVEILLALIALATGLASLYLRRSRRRI